MAAIRKIKKAHNVILNGDKDVRVLAAYPFSLVMFMDLPKREQKDNDWAEDRPDEMFVKFRDKRGNQYVPMENFTRLTESQAGYKVDGGYADTYFSAYYVLFDDPNDAETGLIWVEIL